jgi:hypothetical protein
MPPLAERPSTRTARADLIEIVGAQLFVDTEHLPGIRAARAHARAAAWAACAVPGAGQWLPLDVDATITVDHSDKKSLTASG